MICPTSFEFSVWCLAASPNYSRHRPKHKQLCRVCTPLLLSYSLGRSWFSCDATLEGEAVIYAGSGVPVGESSFEDIVKRGHSFVDKTLIIADFIESTVSITLVIRPRRFGKTVNLSIMKNFFSLPADNEEHRRELFKGSKIEMEKSELFAQHFCKYPVIHINLKVWQRL